jgi:hypothetical protein
MAQPAWLHDRANDPCGTPNKHPFWDGQATTRVGPWKLFERDGTWYGYDTSHNAWAHFPGQAEATEHANRPPVDIWA